MDQQLLPASAKSSSSLAPGFRFHPTDEELVRYYLRRKICRKPLRFDAISEIDIYKVEPWDLPELSRLKTRDLEWYFFSALDKKYGNGSRTNRATDRGYWKTTGKDRAVYHRGQIVGMKKTLVYHNGRAPRGLRTNWVMHEYRLIDEDVEKAGILQDAFVLCRIFQKSGSGPKNGEKYGAPFVDEEWEEDELVIVPEGEHAVELPLSDDAYPDAYLDEHDLEQILGAVDPSQYPPILSNSIADENDLVQEPKICISNTQEAMVGEDVNNFVEQPCDGALPNLPVQYDMDAKSIKDEYNGKPSYTAESCNDDKSVKHESSGEPSSNGQSSNDENPPDVEFLLDLPFIDAIDNRPVDGAFIETDDLNKPVNFDSSSSDMLDEWLQFFDDTDDNSQMMGFEFSNMIGSEEPPFNPASLFPYEDVNDGFKQETVQGKQQLDGNIQDISSSSKQAQSKLLSDYQYPFIKQASQMLGDIAAPPALASEFPTNDAALGPASGSSICVTAGMLQIRNITAGKHDRTNIIFSFGLSRGDEYSKKANSALVRGWFYFMFMWVLILSTSFKIGTYICAN